MKPFKFPVTWFLMIFFFPLIQMQAQSADTTGTHFLKLYYQCSFKCYKTFIKENLPYTEFVRDPDYADVHLVVSVEEAGNGGERYTLTFYRKKQEVSTLQFATSPDQTEEEERRLLLKYIQIGLAPFWSQKGLGYKIEVQIQKAEKQKKATDKWNHWIFNIGSNAYASGSEVRDRVSVNFNARAKQVTEEHKVLFGANYHISRQKIRYGEDIIFSRYDSYYLKYIESWSINKKWSWATVASTGANTYSNYKFFLEGGAGIEYDVYPYKESYKRLITIGNIIRARYNQYLDTTIYFKTREVLYRYELYSNIEFTRKWGSVSGLVSYNVYLHDRDLFSLIFDLNTSIRIYKGLSFNTYASYDILHNQINLPATGTSYEDVLLQQKEVKTGYRFYFMVGLTFSFGSIYNTIVNPRFDF